MRKCGCKNLGKSRPVVHRQRMVAGWLVVAMLTWASGIARGDDWQFWLDTDAGGAITERISIKATQSWRITEDISRFTTFQFDLRPVFSAFTWLDLAPGSESTISVVLSSNRLIKEPIRLSRNL